MLSALQGGMLLLSVHLYIKSFRTQEKLNSSRDFVVIFRFFSKASSVIFCVRIYAF
jgi:hypothetical protein